MSPDQLAFYSGWASIIGLAVSLASLAYVRSIKAPRTRTPDSSFILSESASSTNCCAYQANRPAHCY